MPGRIGSIVNIHNPSVEFHTVDRGINTGAVRDPRRRRRPQHAQRRHRERRLRPVLLQLRRQHRDPAQPAAQGRLRRRRRRGARRAAGDPPGAGARQGAGHRPEQDRHHGLLGRGRAVVGDRGALRGLRQGERAIRRIRWPASRRGRTSSASSIRGRRRSRGTAPRRRFPSDAPPAFIASGASGDRGHAIWAMDYFAAMLQLGVPNIEMHLYGNGRHPAIRSPTAAGRAAA